MVLRGSKTTEAVLPAVDACARSRHAGTLRVSHWHPAHISRSQDYITIVYYTTKWTRGLTRLSGRNSGLPMPQGGLVASRVPILHTVFGTSWQQQKFLFDASGPSPYDWHKLKQTSH